jgi:hypothetical protein
MKSTSEVFLQTCVVNEFWQCFQQCCGAEEKKCHNISLEPELLSKLCFDLICFEF